MRPPKVKVSTILITLLALLWVCSMPAEAQMSPGATTSRIVLLFKDNMANWESVLRNYALGLFWALAGIEFTWSAIKLALRNADLSEFLAELVNRVLYLGFFLTLLLHSSEWANAIVNSFRIAADAAGAGHGISPANILEIAIEITTKLLNNTSIINPQDAIVSGLCAISILLCFGLMAANMIEALVESYFVIAAGVFMMGFGGSSWTNEYAKKILVYAVSVGAKLFLIQLIMGLCERLVAQLATEFNGANIDDALVMVGVAVIMWIVTLNVPNKLQGLINGTSFGQGGVIAGAISAAVAAGAGAAMGAASGGAHTALGMASAGHGTAKLVSEQLKEQGNGMPPSMARKAQLAALALGKGGAEALGQRFRGEVRHGNLGMQVGHNLSQSAEKMKEKAGAGSGPVKPNTPETPANTIRPQ
jgi:type IV secretion system protein TrbL